MAPADRHLRLDGGVLKLSRGHSVSMHRPSGTVFIRIDGEQSGGSRNRRGAHRDGRDGSTGLLKIRKRTGTRCGRRIHGGGLRNAQAAVERGAVRESLPLGGIAPRLHELSRSGSQESFNERQPRMLILETPEAQANEMRLVVRTGGWHTRSRHGKRRSGQL